MTVFGVLTSVILMVFFCVFSGRRFGIHAPLLLAMICAISVVVVLVFSFVLEWILGDVILFVVTSIFVVPTFRTFLQEYRYRSFARAFYCLLPSGCTYASVSWKERRLYLFENTQPSRLTAHACLQYQERLEAFSRESDCPREEWFHLSRHLPSGMRDTVEEVNVHLYHSDGNDFLSFIFYCSSRSPVLFTIPRFALGCSK